MSATDRGIFAALLILTAGIWLAVLAERPLFNPDEGRYAEIPREMLASGEWVLPHLNGLEYIEKPPLQYWLTAASLKLLGNTELAARLYTGLAAFAVLMLVFHVGQRLAGPEAGLLALTSLASMPLFAIFGQLLTLDMGLTLWMSGALVAFLLAQNAPSQEARSQRRYMLIAWGCTALGVMSKGIVAAAIPVAVLVLYSACSRDLAPWRRLNLSQGLPLFLLIAVPWYVLAARSDPDFLQFFFVHEHLQRYLTPEAQRVEPWWFFCAVMLAGCLPWSVSLVRALATGWRRSVRHHGFDARLFLWLWTAFVVFFFSLSDSKLVPYVLPALPSTALLIGLTPEKTLGREMRITLAVTLLCAALIGIGAFELPRLLANSDRREYFLPLQRPLFTVAILLAASGTLLAVNRTFKRARCAMILGTGWCLSWLILMRAASSVAPIYSGEILAQAIPASDPAPVYCIGTYDQTLPFYLGRTVTLVHFQGELEYGLKRRPEAMIPDLSEFIARWNSDSQGYALMEKHMFDDLKSRGAVMRILKVAAGRLVVARQ